MRIRIKIKFLEMFKIEVSKERSFNLVVDNLDNPFITINNKEGWFDLTFSGRLLYQSSLSRKYYEIPTGTEAVFDGEREYFLDIPGINFPEFQIFWIESPLGNFCSLEEYDAREELDTVTEMLSFIFTRRYANDKRSSEEILSDARDMKNRVEMVLNERKKTF